jgi:hypothetical protein
MFVVDELYLFVLKGKLKEVLSSLMMADQR